MSARIHTFCSYFAKNAHTQDQCSNCPQPRFWDQAFADLMDVLQKGA